MKDKYNLVGQKFGKWTVLEDIGIRLKQRSFLCRCECGNESSITGYALRKSRSSSCQSCASTKYPDGCGYKLKVSKFEELMSTWDNKTQDQNVVKLPVFGGTVGKEYIKGFTLIDTEDWDRCSKVMWTSNKANYVMFKYSRRNRERLKVLSKHGIGNKNEGHLLHRFVLNLTNKVENGVIVDHINGDPSDNRKSNLRLANVSQNTANSKPFGKSGYKGVYEDRTSAGTLKYKASIGISGTKNTRHLGYYNTSEEAATAYDKAAKELHGEFARLNFPENIENEK